MHETNGEHVARIARHARAVLADRVDEAIAFIGGYFRHADSSDLGPRRPEDLFGAAIDHARLAHGWHPGETSIEIRNPTIDIDGWESDHTVIAIVVDDQPFLVDSVSMALTRLELGIRLVIHPVFRDHRAIDGTFADPITSPGSASPLVSLILVEIDRVTDPTLLGELAADLRRVLGDVRSAVRDWAAMRSRAAEVADHLESALLPVPADERAEVIEFVRWLVDDHFTFLGARDYELTEDDDGEDVLRPIEDTGLGILRDAPAVVRRLDALPPEARVLARAPRLLNLTKASSRATVHRPGFMDYVGVKTFDAAGTVTGERRFLGLFTAEAYRRSVLDIPILARRAADVMARSDYPPGGHDAKRLLGVLETYPRDEFFQMTADEIAPIALGITQLQERRRIRVFDRVEPYGRFATCLVYLPRDRYTTETRHRIEAVLAEAYGGTVMDWNAMVGESVLARLVFLVRVGPGGAVRPDLGRLEEVIDELIREWGDDLVEALIEAHGEDRGLQLAKRYAGAFPPGYRATNDARAAVNDLVSITLVDGGSPLEVRCYRRAGHAPDELGIKLVCGNGGLSLTRLMPTLSNLGMTVVDERPHAIQRRGEQPVWIYDFSVRRGGADLPFGTVAELVAETIVGSVAGEIADDGFNRLVLAAGLPPTDVAVLRAYARYLRQISSQHSQGFIEATLERHADLAKAIFDLFAVRFDPEVSDPEMAAPALVLDVLSRIDGIENLDEDRILRRFVNLIMATTRTSHFQRDPERRRRSHLAFKFEPRELEDLPEPRPEFEIFVHSARVEGVHLRSGPVARGGLRWSERLEDYRTEVLGLVKAQIVKNAVIVPAGAKGGFIVKRMPADPGEQRAEVEACYRIFVAALLGLTDNLVHGEPVPPPSTRCYDEPDPYLVVAADKGTATFSDLANEISLGQRFWLGDAFASGGSNGYDHKAMGITARGAWESVRRHFHELGRDIDVDGATVVGIGDMSGDVFGNGMLLSDRIRLVAAFDHRHIFIDPEPDPTSSHVERRRLFELPRSSWGQYNRSIISFGGGVFQRSAKSVTLSGPAREALGIEVEHLTPDELISAILKAPVDLLWNGGIGTYVKASVESHLDVGDKSNDGIRVDGADLRCAVVGEGGNLGFTQRGRVEFARRGGQIFTDAIDNSAGVDCSDHEVNVKILLDRVVARGELDADDRNQLLADMTDEIAELVLRHNRSQTLALGIDRAQAHDMVEVFARYIHDLEMRGMLDRALEGLPDADELAERRAAGEGLVTPEFAVLLATTKNALATALLAGVIPDLPSLEAGLVAYFPERLQQRFLADIVSHPLRREIIANRITNGVVDRAGTTMVYRLSGECSMAEADVALAHMAGWHLFDLEPLWREISDLRTIDASTQSSLLLDVRQLGERATRWLLANRPTPVDPQALMATMGSDATRALAEVPDLLLGAARHDFLSRVQHLGDEGVPDELAWKLAALEPATAVLDVVEVAHRTGADVAEVVGCHFAVAARLDLTWLRDQIDDLPRDSHWSTVARLGLRGDLEAAHRRLTEAVIVDHRRAGGADDAMESADVVDAWESRNGDDIARLRRTIADIRGAGRVDLTTLLIACRELGVLVERLDRGRS